MARSGKTSMLAEPEFAKAVAEAYVIGMTRKEMAAEFDCTTNTITAWLRDPRVTGPAAQLTHERILRITRKIDNEIEDRLSTVEDMDTELVLKIRKEYLSKAIIDTSKAQNNASESITDIQGAMEESPEFADAVAKLMGGGK